MSESQSQPSRFFQRKRPTVEARSNPIYDQQDLSSGNEDQRPVDDIAQEAKAVSSSPGAQLEVLQQELDSLPVIVNFQLRIEQGIKADMQRVARERGVTPETLLQGIWSVIRNNEQIMSAAVEDAREGRKRRQRASVLKNSITRVYKALRELGLS